MCHGRVVPGPLRRRIVGLLGVAAAALGLGCAPATGWERIGRVCAADEPPVVCLAAAPDQPVELRFGDVVLVPGECAQPDRARGGTLAAQLHDGRRDQTRRLRIIVGPGRRTVVTVGDAGRPGVERSRCDATASLFDESPDDLAQAVHTAHVAR